MALVRVIGRLRPAVARVFHVILDVWIEVAFLALWVVSMLGFTLILGESGASAALAFPGDLLSGLLNPDGRGVSAIEAFFIILVSTALSVLIAIGAACVLAIIIAVPTLGLGASASEVAEDLQACRLMLERAKGSHQPSDSQ